MARHPLLTHANRFNDFHHYCQPIVKEKLS